MLLSEFLKGMKNSSYLQTKDVVDSMSTERAFAKGRQAKLSGKFKSDNPYTNPGQGAEKAAWAKGWEEESINDSFKESEHPRGQPKNAGQFGPGGAKSKPSKSKPSAANKGAFDEGVDTPRAKKALESVFRKVPGGVEVSIGREGRSEYQRGLTGIKVRGKAIEVDMSIDRRKKDIHLDLVLIKRSEEGKGVGKSVIRRLVGLAKSSGMKQISLIANIKVGTYAWAKIGFDFAHKGELAYMKVDLKDYCDRRRLSTVATRAKIRNLTTAKDIAEFKIGERRIGKEFLLREAGSWEGVLKV